jgi:hypothetical protein
MLCSQFSSFSPICGKKIWRSSLKSIYDQNFAIAEKWETLSKPTFWATFFPRWKLWINFDKQSDQIKQRGFEVAVTSACDWHVGHLLNSNEVYKRRHLLFRGSVQQNLHGNNFCSCKFCWTLPWRHGSVDIASATGTKYPGSNPPQCTSFLG